MFKKKKPEEIVEVKNEQLYHGYGVTTDIDSILKDGTWETTGRIQMRRSSDLIQWEEHRNAVRSISKDYSQSLMTVLQALNSIVNQANEDPTMFKQMADEQSVQDSGQ